MFVFCAHWFFLLPDMQHCSNIQGARLQNTSAKSFLHRTLRVTESHVLRGTKAKSCDQRTSRKSCDTERHPPVSSTSTCLNVVMRMSGGLMYEFLPSLCCKECKHRTPGLSSSISFSTGFSRLQQSLQEVLFHLIGGCEANTIRPKIITLHHAIFQNYLCLK